MLDWKMHQGLMIFMGLPKESAKLPKTACVMASWPQKQCSCTKRKKVNN